MYTANTTPVPPRRWACRCRGGTADRRRDGFARVAVVRPSSSCCVAASPPATSLTAEAFGVTCYRGGNGVRRLHPTRCCIAGHAHEANVALPFQTFFDKVAVRPPCDPTSITSAVCQVSEGAAGRRSATRLPDGYRSHHGRGPGCHHPAGSRWCAASGNPIHPSRWHHHPARIAGTRRCGGV